MSVDSGVRCSCGCRITEKDVQQQGFVMSRSKPVFIYLKYKCPQCHACGEQLIHLEDWSTSLLRDPTELPSKDQEHLTELGAIEPQEVIEFAYRLQWDGPRALRELHTAANDN